MSQEVNLNSKFAGNISKMIQSFGILIISDQGI